MGRIFVTGLKKIPALKLSLNGGEYETFSRQDGRFTFFGVPSGVYVLDVISTEYTFSQVRPFSRCL